MMQNTFARLAPFLLVMTACEIASAEPGETIQLTGPEEIRDASALDRTVVGLSNKVMECVQSKLAPSAKCFCRYPQELSLVKRTYEATLKSHPEWTNKIVSYVLDDRTHAVSLAGLGRQLEQKCP